MLPLLRSISRAAFYSRTINSKGPSLLVVTFRQNTDIHVNGRISYYFDPVTDTTRNMSDESRQKHEEDDGDATSSKKKTTAKERPSKERAATDESPPMKMKYATREGFFKEHQRTVKESKDKFLSMPKDEKRKLYKCKGKFVLLDKIPTWPEHFQEELTDDEDISRWWKRNKKHVKTDVKENLNSKISLFRGDITALEIDAIVNAANESLLGGGGVDGAIHAAAGPGLRSECELLNGCKCGEAKITCGYKLPAKYVIHTVGPRGEQTGKLESCYTQCLNLVKENQLKSVAFPCISTGIFGYPNENAAIVALRTIRNWLDNEDYAENIERIIFCLFLQKDVDIYDRQTQMFFPLDQDQATSTDF